jgi:hypothetical protein
MKEDEPTISEVRWKMTENSNKASFFRHLGERFSVRLDSSEQIEMVLIEVEGLSKPGKDPGSEPKDPDEIRKDPFTALFRGPHEPFLRQKIRELEHDQMGEIEIFMVPVGRDEMGLYYESVFN